MFHAEYDLLFHIALAHFGVGIQHMPWLAIAMAESEVHVVLQKYSYLNL